MTNSPRLRIFAGPNGSGKSTIIEAIKNDHTAGRPINLGKYINADDIAAQLRNGGFPLADFDLEYDDEGFKGFAGSSGLLSDAFNIDALNASMSVNDQIIYAKVDDSVERLAQIIARYLREKMLERNITFSFETVFSHRSNIELMKAAAGQGYKVYLYMVATASPEINIFRVQARVKQQGHDVPADIITSRYYRSLGLMFEAAQLCYQAYFFDNSVDESPFRKIAHFKNVDGKKVWEDTGIKPEDLPEWFIQHYLGKVNSGA